MHLENAFRFLLWAQSLHRMPTVAEIAHHWNCGRATAYRYRNALADAMGEYIEPQRGQQALPETYRAGNGNVRKRYMALKRAA